MEKGKYCYNLLTELICGKYANKEETRRGYEGWSPNNVRKVVISPDGILLMFYVRMETTSGALVKIKKFDQIQYRENLATCGENYKTMLSALVEYRICSAIEEIIILDYVGNRTLHPDEYNFNSLVKNSQNSISFESRFSRLNNISYFLCEEGSFNVLRERLANIEIEPKTLFKDVCLECNFTPKSIYTCNNKNWYKLYPNLQAYSSDKGGYIEDNIYDGKIGSYFDKLIKRINRQEEIDRKSTNNKIDDENAKNLKTLSVFINNCLSTLKILSVLVQECNTQSDKIESFTYKNFTYSQLLKPMARKPSYIARVKSIVDGKGMVQFLSRFDIKANSEQKELLRELLAISTATREESFEKNIGIYIDTYKCVAMNTIEHTFTVLYGVLSDRKAKYGGLFKVAMRSLGTNNYTVFSGSKYSEMIAEELFEIQNNNITLNLVLDLAYCLKLFTDINVDRESKYSKLSLNDFEQEIDKGV